jgi:hypothetical protein
MPELSIDAIGVAVATQHRFVPISAELAAGLPAERLAATGIPLERLMVLGAENGSGDPSVGPRALAALGVPPAPEPLFYVRSGPPYDPMVCALAGLVHGSGWAGEEVGITHLDELGGSMVFDLLDWAVPATGTALICDEPVFCDARAGHARYSAVGLRLRRGAGPLRVLGCGEGRPSYAPGRVFGGRGPCDAWLAFYTALRAGQVEDGERVLLHTRGPVREGWLSLRAVEIGALALTGNITERPYRIRLFDHLGTTAQRGLVSSVGVGSGFG